MNQEEYFIHKQYLIDEIKSRFGGMGEYAMSELDAADRMDFLGPTIGATIHEAEVSLKHLREMYNLKDSEESLMRCLSSNQNNQITE